MREEDPWGWEGCFAEEGRERRRVEVSSRTNERNETRRDRIDLPGRLLKVQVYSGEASSRDWVFQPATSDSVLLRPDRSVLRSSPSFSEQVERQDQAVDLLHSPLET